MANEVGSLNGVAFGNVGALNSVAPGNIAAIDGVQFVTTAADSIELDKTILYFYFDGSPYGDDYIWVTASGSWTMLRQDVGYGTSWLTADKYSGSAGTEKVTLSVGNNLGNSREMNLYFQRGTASANCYISQDANEG